MDAEISGGAASGSGSKTSVLLLPAPTMRIGHCGGEHFGAPQLQAARANGGGVLARHIEIGAHHMLGPAERGERLWRQLFIAPRRDR